MLRLIPCLLLLAHASCDVSHLDHTSTEPPPPRPYAFAYTAGRFSGHADRHHAEVSDGSGVIRGKDLEGRMKRAMLKITLVDCIAKAVIRSRAKVVDVGKA